MLGESKTFRLSHKTISYTKHGLYKGRNVLSYIVRPLVTQGQPKTGVYIRKKCSVIRPAGHVCLVLSGNLGRLLFKLLIFPFSG